MTGGGTVDAPIGRHRRERTKMAVTESGRAARTRYRVVERFRAHTYCELELETGRTHQIRVHMAHIRAPLLGDPVYGVPTAKQSKWTALPMDVRAAVEALPGQALHARVLGFTHPVTGAAVRVEAEPPPAFARLLAALKTYSG